MGLEIVEIIMGLEQEFDISLKHEDLKKIETVGQLYQLVIKELGHPDPYRCYSSNVFYRFRRSLTKIIGTPRNKVLPCRDVEGYLPAEDYRRYQHQLAHEMDLRLPDLVRPGWVHSLYEFIRWTSWLQLLFLAPLLSQFISLISAFICSVAVLLILSLVNKLLMHYTKPLILLYPYKTTRELVERIALMNYERLSGDFNAVSNNVYLRFKKVFLEQIGDDLDMSDDLYRKYS